APAAARRRIAGRRRTRDYFLSDLRTRGAEAAAAAPSRAARMRAFLRGSMAFHSRARRVAVFFEAADARPTVRQTAVAPSPVASAIAARATVPPPVIDRITPSKLTPLRRAGRRFAAGRRRDAAGFRVADDLRAGRAAGLRRAGLRPAPEDVAEISPTLPAPPESRSFCIEIPHFSPAATNTGAMSTGMSWSRALTASISGVALP